MPKIKEYNVVSDCDELKIDVIEVIPDGEIKGILQMSHGMAEHKERYLPMMKFLAARGYVCVMNDHRGHGKSIHDADGLGYFGKKGAKYLVDDLHQITMLLREEYPSKPLCLYGHSMGSLAVRSYRNLYDKDIDALIVCGSPGRNPAVNMGLTLVTVLTVFRGARHRSAMVEKMTGGMSARFAAEGSPFAWLSTVKEEVVKYENDPLCGFRFTLNGYKALLDLMKDAYRLVPASHDIPVLFIAGADDPCLPDQAGFDDAVKAMRDNGLSNVEARLYEGKRHEIHNEDIRETVYGDIADKLDEWFNAKS